MKRDMDEFLNRLNRHMDELRWLYMELYDNGSMFAELCSQLEAFYKERGTELKNVTERSWRHRTGFRNRICLA